MAWTDESRARAVEMYQENDPTPENTIEIIKEIAEDLGESPNGVKQILVKAGVYVKTAAAPKSKAASGESKGTRVSKEDSIQALRDVIESKGLTVDEDIISRLTGKAAVYFAGLFS